MLGWMRRPNRGTGQSDGPAPNDRPAACAGNTELVGTTVKLPPRGALGREFGIVDNRVAVVDAVNLQQIDGRAHIAPGHPELARVCGGPQAGLARIGVSLRKQLRWPIHLPVVHADAGHLVATIADDPADHLHRLLGRRLAVDCRHQPAGDAEVRLRIRHGAQDGLLRQRIGNPGLARRAGRIPEELGVTHGVRGRILQVFVGDAVQVVRTAQQPRVQGPQHAQHAHRLLAAGVEGLDLRGIERRLFPPGQLGEGVLPDGSQQVAVQFRLGQGAQEVEQGQHGVWRKRKNEFTTGVSGNSRTSPTNRSGCSNAAK